MNTQDLFIPGIAGRLSVRIKRPTGAAKQAVVLVQGSNLSGQGIFDFPYRGDGPTYSVMDALVARGYAAITFAIRGYGQSDAPADPFSVVTETAMEDLDTVMNWAVAQGFARPHVMAFSWGGRIAGRYAETHGAKLDRLVLYDPARGGGQLVLPCPTPDQGWWTNLPKHYRDKLLPRFTDPGLLDALDSYVLTVEQRSPNGIRVENAHPMIAVEPSRITRPTLMIYGVEAAKANYMQGGLDRATFFEQLATDDKAFVILPGGDDFIHLQAGRERFHACVADFLDLS